MFAITLTNRAEKQLGELEPKMRKRVDELFELLQHQPVPAEEYDLIKINGEDSTYRIRLSSFRVLYRVYWEKKEIGIAKIERRSDNTYD